MELGNRLNLEVSIWFHGYVDVDIFRCIEVSININVHMGNIYIPVFLSSVYWEDQRSKLHPVVMNTSCTQILAFKYHSSKCKSGAGTIPDTSGTSYYSTK